MTDLEIFHNAPSNASTEELSAYLEKACGDNAELRGKVEQLLAQRSGTDDFLDQPLIDLDAPTIGPEGQSSGKAPSRRSAAVESKPTPKISSEQEGDVIGLFTLIKKLGEGGFGTVWLAEQKQPFARTVALKIIKLGMDTHEVLTRFEAERQALARMDHAHIAKVLDAGATENGRPYFVMELVDGITITKYCDHHQLDTRQRLELFRAVCAALNHAHQKGMIHRDIKPSNVMVATQDGKPVVKVIDFGIAKATEGKLTENTLVTLQEQVIGTPAYMSPEQAGMDGLDIDTRSDIYSLGVLLYELISGKPPFDPKSLMSAGFDEMRRIVREQEPPRPSNRVNTITNAEETVNITTTHGVEPHRLSRILRGDLDWIVMKAIEKDRGRRYETANAFSADIERFLTNEPVSAAAPSISYQFRKFARRNQGSLVVSALIAVVLVLATVVSVRQAIRANQAQQIAEQNSKELRHQLYDSDMMRASQAMEVPGGLTSALAINKKWIPKEGEEDLRGWEWYYQRSTEVANTRSFFFPSEDDNIAIVDMQWFPDSRRFLAMAGGTVVIWDFKTKMRLAKIENGDALGLAIDIHPDGDRLAIAWDNEEVTVHDAKYGAEILRFPVTQRVEDIAWREADGEGQLVTVGVGVIQFFDDSTGSVSQEEIELPIAQLPVFSPDGSQLAYFTAGNTPNLHIVETTFGSNMRNIEFREGWRFRRIRWHPNGGTICVVSVWGNSYLVDSKSDSDRQNFSAEGNDVAWSVRNETIIWSPHARRALEFRSYSEPHSVKDYWNTGTELAHVLAASGDGDWLLTSEDGGRKILVWPLHAASRMPIKIDGNDVKGPDEITWSPNKLAAGGKVISSRWNRKSGTVAADIDFWSCPHVRASADWHPNGVHLAVLNGFQNGILEVRNETLGLTEFQTIAPDGIRWVGWNHDGSRLAMRSHAAPGNWIVYESGSFREVFRLPTNASGIWLSGNDGLLLSNEHELWIADPESGKTVRRLVDLPTAARAKKNVEQGTAGRSVLALSPDQSRVAAGSYDQPVTIWNTVTWEKIHTLWHGEPIQTIAWNPSGSRLITGTDVSIRIWNPMRGSEILRINKMGADPIRWSPDGTTIANGTRDEAVAYLWDTRSARRNETLNQSRVLIETYDWEAAAKAILIGLTTYQSASDELWFHAGWWEKSGDFPPRGEIPKEHGLSKILVQSPKLARADWVTAETDADDLISLSGADTSSEKTTYLSRYYLAFEIPLTVCIDINSPGEIWLGGEQIFSSENQPIGRRELPITLQPGWNDFIVHLPKKSSHTELQLRLTTLGDDIMPFQDIELITEEQELTEEQRRQRVQDVIAKDPGDPKSWRDLAQIELYHNHLGKAAAALHQAFALAPDHYEAMGLLARLLKEQTAKTGSADQGPVPTNFAAASVARIIHASEAGFFPRAPVPVSAESLAEASSFFNEFQRSPDPLSEAEAEKALVEIASWLPEPHRAGWLARWRPAFGGGLPNKDNPPSVPANVYRRASVQLLSGEYQSGLLSLKKFADQTPDKNNGHARQKIDQLLELSVEEALGRFQSCISQRQQDSAQQNLAQAIILATHPVGAERSRIRRIQTFNAIATELGKEARMLLQSEDIQNAAELGRCLTEIYSEKMIIRFEEHEAFRDSTDEQTGYAMLELSRAMEAVGLDEDGLMLKEAARRVALLNPEGHLLLYVDHSLGGSYWKAERYDDALAARELALKLSREYRGANDGFTLGLLWQLARSYERAGRLDEAISLAKELVAANIKVNGADNGLTLDAQGELIRYYEANGNTAEADAVRATLPPRLTDRLKEKIENAVALASGGDSENALQLWGDLEPEIAKLTPVDQVTALSDLRPVAVEFTKKRIYPDETLAIRHAFIAACETAHGPDHQQTLYGKVGLAETLEALKRFDEALRLRQDATNRAFEHNHSGVEFHARNGLANLLHRSGRHEEALPHFHRVLVLGKEHRKPDDWMVRSIFVQFTSTLEELGRFDEAINLAEQWVEQETEINGPDHPDTQKAMNTLSRCRKLEAKPSVPK